MAPDLGYDMSQKQTKKLIPHAIPTQFKSALSPDMSVGSITYTFNIPSVCHQYTSSLQYNQ